ncbi:MULTISPECIES: hypothetical protein [unclassified Clostridioides]|uniref:hypothetical protein n=1 Tax=unclassified Clostridioides TaxID=2635829 RepID=UPI001D0C26EC|nr:hypothetical protein [Clostridioides sp. ES-S-0001-03]MCC0696230.1 hypothetical protein [Clostridioides sp. ES-S-0048-02]
MNELIQCDFCKKTINVEKQKYFINKEKGNTSLLRYIDIRICEDCWNLGIKNYCKNKEGAKND